ncbi:sulfurtransferase TusA family protein [Caloramator sp. Dgby_cultured_2]|uniref:sulfurtransferase TusA family protein n=1 Tax=Caloramator sp. Dgby_cultured_2 TaxID=3029174 RepID=UPI00237E9753|nr:sulfurtransferase TusA family protein [Caloramator sp. Dgby_cultured_2]WDU84688.1 sulfurtransferase TusA family protein [Caloramator sp. Dgby_cultured_2]
MTKKAIEASPDGVKVLVDNATAKENIKRFAKNSGYNVEVVENDEGILLTLSR